MQYLSDEWIAAAHAAVSGLEPTAEPFAVGYVITDGPAGDREYTLTLGPDAVGLRTGTHAPVGLRMTWDVACAIATGRISAQRAFLDGKMRIDGDAQALLGHLEALTGVDDALADLRSRTHF